MREGDAVSDAALAPKDAALYLGIGLTRLWHLSHGGLIPCRNISPGGKKAAFRYSPKALDGWLEGDREGAAPKVLPSVPRPRRKAQHHAGVRG